MTIVGRLFGLRAAASAITVLALVAGLVLAPGVALLLAPAVALIVLLAHGVFVGEDVIERLRIRRAGSRGRRRPSVVAFPRPLHIARRTGRLIAFALAVRPPPRASLQS